MKRIILVAVVASFGLPVRGDVPAEPPATITEQLQIQCRNWCELPAGRQQAHDPETGIFRIHFRRGGGGVPDPSAFEVTKVPRSFEKPLVFRLTGVPAWYGLAGYPLALSVGGNNYVIDLESVPGQLMASVGSRDGRFGDICDRTLFRVERRGEVVTVEFTARGQALLRPGAQIWFAWAHGW
jgi:hypothetical protein